MNNTLPRMFDKDRYQQLFEKGVAAWKSNSLPEAKVAFRTILRDKPGHAESLRFLALVIRREGQMAISRELFERAIRAEPNNPNILNDFANLLIEMKEYDTATALAEKSVALSPNLSDCHTNFGLIAMRRDQDEAAIAHFDQALSLNPGCTIARANRASCEARHSTGGVMRTEVEILTETVEREPDNAKAHLILALMLEKEGKLSRAIVHAYRSCQLDMQASNLGQLGSFLCSMGDFKEAMPVFRAGVERAPYNAEGMAAYLFSLNYDPATTADELFTTYSTFVERFLKPSRKLRHRGQRNTAGRKIRIGYSSPDFREHSMFYFITPIVAAHDKSRFELFAYSNSKVYDAKSEIIRGHFDHWVDVTSLSNEAMAQKIQDDDIDILIDLAGHSRDNRLAVFAMRAAPIQVSYLGYGYTTGLSEVDYFIGDENLTPPEADRHFAEQVWRVPSPAYCYSPPATAQIDVVPLPALSNGYVTFGSMSRLIRMNDAVLQTWLTILNRVPGSKLRLDSMPLADLETCELMKTRLIKLGFAPEQLELGCTRPHWNGYSRFDISLDCWPHNTGTTTLDALWMGVPVLSKLDRPSVGRFGATFLRPLGLDDWIVDDVPTYIEKAVAYANDLPLLAKLRQELRGRIQASDLMRPAVMAGKLEAMYEEALRRHEQKKVA